MIPKIETFCQLIANEMSNVLPDSWKQARVNAIFYSDDITWEPEFDTVEGEVRSFDVTREFRRAVKDLRRAFENAGQPLWGQVLFELEPDGEFNVKRGYENCDEHGDTIWNEVDWRRRQEDRHRRLTQ